MGQKNQKLTDLYQSSDLSLVCTISLWYPIDTIDRQNPRKSTFLFKRDDRLDELLRLYWKRQLKVEPQVYSNQLKTSKARLTEKGNHGK